MVKVENGQQIGEITCPGCGRTDLPVKVNTAGNVYYFCAKVVGTMNGKPDKCFTRFTYGRAASERKKAEFLKHQEEETNVREHEVHEEKQPATQPTGDNHEQPSTEPARDIGKSIIGWITG